MADDLIWGTEADDLNYRVALLDKMLTVDPLTPGRKVTKKMVAGLTRAAREATTRLQAYQGVVA